MKKCTIRFRENQTMRKSSGLRRENNKLTKINKDFCASRMLGGSRLAESSLDIALFIFRVQAVKSRKLSSAIRKRLITAQALILRVSFDNNYFNRGLAIAL